MQEFKEHSLKNKKYIFGFSEKIKTYTEKVQRPWDKTRFWENHVIEPESIQTICYCSEKKYVSNGAHCDLCGRKYNHIKETVLTTKETYKQVYSWIQDNNLSSDYNIKEVKPTDSLILETFLFVYPHPEDTTGIIISKITVKTNKISENQQDLIDLEFKETQRLEIIPNQEYKAFKVLKNKTEPIEIEDILPISTNLLEKDINIEFLNSDSVFDFLLQNKDFSERTGIIKFAKTLNTKMMPNAFFIFYTYLYAKYPVVEFLIKMEHFSLIENLIKDILNKYNKEEIKQEINQLSKLFNNTTKGSLALTIPSYISDFLRNKNADYKEYLMWCDIYELENISKENFEIFINSREYLEFSFNGNIPYLIPLLKYGYTIQRISKYLLSQIKGIKDNRIFKESANLMQDYLNIYDLMQLEFEKFPQNIIKAHDNAVKLYKAQKDEEKDKIMTLIAQKYEKSIPLPLRILDEEFIISIPKNLKDLSDEGAQQHNCVGSYYDRIIRGQSIVFFIRNKKTPQESLITCEFANDKLEQIKRKYNKPVNNTELIDYANKFCKSIISLNRKE